MEEIRATAFKSITQKKRELEGKAMVGEADLLAAQPPEGGRLGPLMRHYSKVYDDLADYCVEQYRWANEHSGRSGLRNKSPWFQAMLEHMAGSHELARGRVSVMSESFGVTERFMVDAHLELLNQVFDSTCHRLLLNLERAEAEFAGARRKRQREIVEKIILLIVGAAIGCAGTVLTGWLAPKPGSNQSSSPSASSNPTPTPQTSGTPVPSAPLSAAPPHATHPLPATPSSTRRP